MYAVILDGTDEFIDDAMSELKAKNFNPLCRQAACSQSVVGFDSIVSGLKQLKTYKKNPSKNTIYKTSSLQTIS